MKDELDMNANLLVEFLQKPSAEFTKADIVSYIKEKNIRMVNFMYPAGDGRLKTLNFVFLEYCFLEIFQSCFLHLLIYCLIKSQQSRFLENCVAGFSIYLLFIFNLLKIIIKAPIIISKTPGEAFINFDVKSVPSIIQLMFPVNPKMVSIIPPIMQKMPLHKLKIIIIYSYFIAVSPKAVLAILGSISTAQLCKQRKAKIEIMSIYIVLFILF